MSDFRCQKSEAEASTVVLQPSAPAPEFARKNRIDSIFAKY